MEGLNELYGDNTMKIELQLMKIEEKALLVRLMELYNYEFTAYNDADINEFGYFGYDHIDDYWNEERRYPYLIRVDGKIAGFALVCPHRRFLEDENGQSIGEFFVMLKYRHMGVGKKAATEIFSRHKGAWEVCYLKRNTPAKIFWEKVIDHYTGGHYEACGENDREMSGFTFLAV